MPDDNSLSPEMQPGAGSAGQQMPVQPASGQDLLSQLQPHLDVADQVTNLHRQADAHDRSQRRKDLLSNALTNFVFSMGQGLSASASAPRGQENAAGAGAALQGPQMLQQMRQQMAQRQAQIQDTQAQTKLRLAQGQPMPIFDADGKPIFDADGKPSMMPGMYAQAFNQHMATQAQINKRDAKHNAIQGFKNTLAAAKSEFDVDEDENGNPVLSPKAYENLTPQQKAKRNKDTNDAALAKSKVDNPVMNGVMYQRGEDGTLTPVGGQVGLIDVTPELAEQWGVPRSMAGTMPLSAFEGLIQNMGVKPVRIVTGDDHNWAYNVITKQRTDLGKAQPKFNPAGNTTVGTETDPVSGQNRNVIIDKTNGTSTPIVGAGGAQSAKVGATELRQRDQARQIQTQVDNINGLITAHPEWLGPWMGRVYKAEKVVGTIPAGANELATALVSLASQQPVLHGFRGGVGVAKTFEDTIGSLQMTPDALRGSLKGIRDLAENVRTGNAAAEQRPLPPKSGAMVTPDVIKAYGAITGNDAARTRKLLLSDGWKIPQKGQ